jgi:hypothetical protein
MDALLALAVLAGPTTKLQQTECDLARVQVDQQALAASTKALWFVHSP